jgi:hypothetical protein
MWNKLDPAFALGLFLLGCAAPQKPGKIIHNNQIALYGDDGEPNFCAQENMQVDSRGYLCTLKEEFVPAICKGIVQEVDKDYCTKIRAGLPKCPVGGPYTDECARHPLDPGI